MTDPNPSQPPISEEKSQNASAERPSGAIEKEVSIAPSGVPGWERATLERLAYATLEEQRLARRWRGFCGLARLVVAVALGWVLVSRH